MLSENIFKQIVELSPFPVYVTTGADMIITVANDATLKAWGRDKSVIGQPFEEALPELHDQPFSKLIRQVMRTGEPYYTEHDHADLMVEGQLQRFYFKFSYQPLKNEAGEITSVLCLATDVTEQERARLALEQSRTTLYNMVRQAPLGICIIGVNELIVDIVNDAYLELVGRKREDVENRSIWESIPEAAPSYKPVMDKVISTGTTFYAKEHEIMLLRKGVEEIVFIDFVYEPVRDINGQVSSIMAIAIDVTDKALARKSIEEAEERARLAIDVSRIGTFDFNQITNELRTSDRFNEIFGFEHQVTWDEYIDLVHPEDRGIREEAYRLSRETGVVFYEIRIVWKDQSIHWIRAQAKTYLDSEGNATRLLGTALDITEYKRLQQQKDDFLSVASHELKTPMTSMKAIMQVLGRMVKTEPASEKIPQFIEKANSSLAKMQQLVESLLNVSKISSGQLSLQKSKFVVATMISECCDDVRMADEYELVTTGDMELSVAADRYKVDQVVVNLVNNAIKYAPESKRIIIHISKTEQNQVKISVTDKGPGIAASKLPHIFDRYYRIDASGLQYSGLGLGLYISADIIARHGGQIGAESKEGEGSTFWFTLPL